MVVMMAETSLCLSRQGISSPGSEAKRRGGRTASRLGSAAGRAWRTSFLFAVGRRLAPLVRRVWVYRDVIMMLS